MDPILVEIVATIILTITGGAVTYIHTQLNRMETAHDTLDDAFHEHLLTMADKFVAKGDYREDMREIKDTLREMRGDVKAILGMPEAPAHD